MLEQATEIEQTEQVVGPVGRQILTALAEAGQAMETTEIVQQCGIPYRQMRPALSRLHVTNLVRLEVLITGARSPQGGGKTPGRTGGAVRFWTLTKAGKAAARPPAEDHPIERAEIEELFRRDPTMTTGEAAARLGGITRRHLLREADRHGGWVEIRRAVTGEGKVVTYRLTPEEIAEKYGPPTRQPVAGKDDGEMALTKEQTLQLREQIRAAARSNPAHTAATLARALFPATYNQVAAALVRMGGIAAVRQEVRALGPAGPAAETAGDAAGQPAPEPEQPTALEDPDFQDAVYRLPEPEPEVQLPPEPEPPAPLVAACRVCGCTDDNACPGGCEWAEPDLCSWCAAPDADCEPEPARQQRPMARRAPGPTVRQEHIIDGRMSLSRLMSIILALRGLSESELTAEVWLRVASEG